MMVGIISYLKPEGYYVKNEKTNVYFDSIDSIKLIESVYHAGNGCFSVVNKRNLSMLTSASSSRWKIWRQK